MSCVVLPNQEYRIDNIKAGVYKIQYCFGKSVLFGKGRFEKPKNFRALSKAIQFVEDGTTSYTRILTEYNEANLAASDVSGPITEAEYGDKKEVKP
jgi:hypothetical protein